MPAALGHLGEGAECPQGQDLVCLDLAFLGQTEVFPGTLCEPVPWLGVEGDPCLGCCGVKAQVWHCALTDTTDVLLEWEVERNNLADFSKALGFGVRSSSVHQILALAAGCITGAVPSGFSWMITSRACTVTNNMN